MTIYVGHPIVPELCRRVAQSRHIVARPSPDKIMENKGVSRTGPIVISSADAISHVAVAQASCLLSFSPVHRLLRLLDPSSLLQAWSSSLGISVPYLERQKICGESRLSLKHLTTRTKCRYAVSLSGHVLLLNV